MAKLQRINLSAAIIALICFFLPWEQVSCGGARDTLSGLDLARHGHGLLWFAPILLVFAILLGLLHAWREMPRLYSVISGAAGIIVVYLMNHQRAEVRSESGLIEIQLSAWFWIGFVSALVVCFSALALFLKSQRAP